MTISISDCKTAFASPDSNSLIDVIHPETNTGIYSNETLEQIRERYPAAEVVNIDDWCKAKAARQDSPVVWDEITEEQYWCWLECLPPAVRLGGAFLVGEPHDHHATSGMPRYQACNETGGKWFTSSRPMSVKEFRAMFGKTS